MNKKISEQLNALKAVRDNKGMPIDDGIIKTVAVLNILSFVTTSSCEGHKNKELPYIDISGEAANNKLINDTIKVSWNLLSKNLSDAKLNEEYNLALKPVILNNGIEAVRLDSYIRKFYFEGSKICDYLYGLQLFPLGGGYGGYRLTCKASVLNRLYDPELQDELLIKVQREFNLFTEFLTNQIT